MIIEHRTVEIEKRLSDYCKGCDYFTPVVEVVKCVQDGNLKKTHRKMCVL